MVVGAAFGIDDGVARVDAHAGGADPMIGVDDEIGGGDGAGRGDDASAGSLNDVVAGGDHVARHGDVAVVVVEMNAR